MFIGIFKPEKFYVKKSTFRSKMEVLLFQYFMYFWKVKDKKEISSGKLKIAVIETCQEAGMYEYAWSTCFNWQVTLFQACYSLNTHIMYVAH